MLWDCLYDLVPHSASGAPPDVIIIHLGGNDLTIRSGKSLIIQITADLTTLQEHFPSARLIWSNIIQRKTWRACCDSRKIDRSRWGVNREVSRTMRNGLGAVIEHPQFRMERPDLYRSDGVHLSEVDLNIFLNGL